jgi:hypothetical protein
MSSPNTGFRTELNPHFRPWIFIAVAVWVLVVVLAACQGRPPPLESRDQPVSTDAVTSRGFRGVEFGMTARQASAAYPGGLVVLGDAAPPPGECYYIGPDQHNYAIAFMVVSGTVQRVDISHSGIETERGAAIGMALDDVAALYPGATRRPDKYAPRQVNLVAPLESPARAVFEEAGGQIRAYHVGLPPAVDYVEGCA